MAKEYAQQYEELGTKSLKTGRTPKYVVSLTFQGTWECSCPSWCTIVPRQDCKHILRRKFKLMNEGEKLPGVPTMEATVLKKSNKVEQEQEIVRTISFEDL